ncbi:MAG: hypothetical protein ACE5RI_06890 [Candidatus Nitrosomaritimum yanchengensis]
MKISDFTCVGKEPHSFSMEIPDGASYEEFTENTSCSKCGARLIKTEKNSPGEKDKNKI